MSEATTGLFNNAPVFPRLVLDETLKRARVETETGSAIQTTISGVDDGHPLPVLMKSDKTQWFLRGEYSGNTFRYYRLQWFNASPQPLIYNYGNNKWVYVSPKATKTPPGNAQPDLTKPSTYMFSMGTSSAFEGGWVAGYSDSSTPSQPTLLAYKAGNTDVSSPDLEIGIDGYFDWEGDDFYNCERYFDSPILYLNKVGGQVTDQAWTGAGSGTVISLLKGIANIF